MTIERRTFTIELRANQPGESAKGYAAMFNADSHDLGGFVERIAPGAFARSLQQADLGKLNIHALWAHDTSQPLGSTRSGKLKLAEDGSGLAFDLDTARFSPAQLDALADNDLQMSFGFGVREQEWKNLDDGTILRTLIDVDLIEVSFVINPAYPDTSAALRSLDDWKAEMVESIEIEKYNSAELTRRALATIVSRRIG